MTQFRKGILIGMLAISLVIGVIFGVGAVQVSNEPQPAVQASIHPQMYEQPQAYLYGDYFVAVVPLSEAGARALEWQVGDLDEWIGQQVYKRAQDASEELLIRALQDTTNMYLTKLQKEAFGAEMIKRGIYLCTYEAIPDDLKAQMVIECRVQ